MKGLPDEKLRLEFLIFRVRVRFRVRFRVSAKGKVRVRMPPSARS